MEMHTRLEESVAPRFRSLKFPLEGSTATAMGAKGLCWESPRDATWRNGVATSPHQVAQPCNFYSLLGLFKDVQSHISTQKLKQSIWANKDWYGVLLCIAAWLHPSKLPKMWGHLVRLVPELWALSIFFLRHSRVWSHHPPHWYWPILNRSWKTIILAAIFWSQDVSRFRSFFGEREAASEARWMGLTCIMSRYVHGVVSSIHAQPLDVW